MSAGPNQAAELPAGFALDVLGASPDGVVIVDGDHPEQPVCWVNRAFESLSGFAAAELLGRNLRVLQGGDREQPACGELHEALAAGQACRVLLRNYRPDGTMWWNELEIEPLQDGEGRRWWAGFAHDVTARREMELLLGRRSEELHATQRQLAEVDPVDRLTGLQSERSFEVALELSWFSCARDGRSLALFLFAPDAFEVYLDTFGRVAGDSSLRMLSRAVGIAFRRASDVTARLGDYHFGALGVGMEREVLAGHARRVCDHVRMLAIHNPRAPLARNLTLSAVIAIAQPSRSPDWRKLLESAREALASAQADGIEKVVVIE
jgi:diguanylate cyclase (GGDEF)-like protein/PAS domain S-box-containing protein